MESSSASDSPSSRDSDQASYFYVVWPEETVTTVSGNGSGEPCSSPQRTAAQQHHHRHHPYVPRQSGAHEHRESEHHYRHYHSKQLQPNAASPPRSSGPGVTSAGAARSVSSQMPSAAGRSPVAISATGHAQPLPSSVVLSPDRGIAGLSALGRTAVDTHRTSGCTIRSSPPQGASDLSPPTGQPSSPITNSLLSSGMSNGFKAGTPPPPLPPPPQSSSSIAAAAATVGGGGGGGGGGVHSERYSSLEQDFVHHSQRRAKMQYYDLNGCLECEVKDAEIKTLRRRIQVMEEVVALLNQKMNSLQQNNNLLFSQMVMPAPVVSQVVIPTTVKSHIADHGNHHERNSANGSGLSPRLSDSEDGASEHAGIAYAQPELCPTSEHRVELIPGSGVYLSLPRREESRREAKNGTQLARKLMDAFWDRDTLAQSSLSSKSKFKYKQLDPKVINAIEAFCLAFDPSTHSRDLHACMTDKCCQARSRRGSFKVTGIQNNHINGVN